MATQHPSAPPPARMPPSLPHFTLSKGKHTNTIKIHGWTITATKKPILNGKEIEVAEKRLGLPLPEMTFGNNSLTLYYSPSSTSSSTSFPDSSSPTAASSAPAACAAGESEETRDVKLEWHTIPALSHVGVGDSWEDEVGGGVQVSMAAAWSKGRSSPSLLSSTDGPIEVKAVRPHDWTYSTTHTGDVAGPSTFNRSAEHSLPLPLLARQDPVLDQILFYEDVSLFEDELHDNGESILNVRIRVMPHCWFILSRLFLRVDSVLFRIYDVRVYHAFGSGHVVREVKGMEASYDDVKAKLESPTDLSPLTEPNFVYAYMTSRPPVVDDQGRPKLDHRPTGLKRGKAWPGLGEYVEVLHLPSSNPMDGVADRVSKVQL